MTYRIPKCGDLVYLDPTYKFRLGQIGLVIDGPLKLHSRYGHVKILWPDKSMSIEYYSSDGKQIRIIAR